VAFGVAFDAAVGEREKGTRLSLCSDGRAGEAAMLKLSSWK
jgi:hypothetical protein